MTKQEEIREGMDNLLKDVLRAFKKGEWVDTATVTRKIQEFEASQGVVIQVDRELPGDFCECCKHYDVKAEDGCNYEAYCGYDYAGWEFAGYVAVVPLIEEGL